MKFVISRIFILIGLTTIATSFQPSNSKFTKDSPEYSSRGVGFKHGEFPWIVALFNKKTQPAAYFCGGTLISSTFVLSAAQCVHQKNSEDGVPVGDILQKEDILAVFGAHDLKVSNVNTFVVAPDRIIIHEDWKPIAQDYDADLMLLQFQEGKIVFSQYVKPVYLWTSTGEPPRTQGVIVGWTKTENATTEQENTPKKLQVPIQTNEECFLTTKALIYLSSRRTFCAGFRNFSDIPTNGLGVCRGDRGSGLVIMVDGIVYFKGVMSSTVAEEESNCDVTRNAVYSNVLKFQDWIVNNTQLPVQSFAPPVPEVKQIPCTLETRYSSGHLINICFINQAIDDEETVLGTEVDQAVVIFSSQYRKDVKFIPKRIGQKLPNLTSFFVNNCSLTIVRDYNFKDLTNLRVLDLTDNQIVTIESAAFKDQTELKYLNLMNNRIETLDVYIFKTMTELEAIDLRFNLIKVLSPQTFTIPGENLKDVYLAGNICIRKNYKYSLNKLINDLKTKCQPTRRPFPRY